ncbi:NAD-dependent protein deacetylase sirtuin-2 [Dissophora globulifera]|nr:NAD-dependent protein deacetylase sirtuin-2 [Dissophora globulifera]
MSSAAAVRIPIKSRPLKPIPEPEPRVQILKDDTISSIADLITTGNAKNIIVMTGAGISTAAGIKDFRSPGTGLYDDLEKYNLPFPEAVFDLGFFKETPHPFYQLAKHLYPGRYRPTLTHYLLPLLAKKKLLLRSYTQNIDSLERLAGLDEELLVEAHGSFAISKCVQCDMISDPAWVKRHIMDGDIPYCKRCAGLVKPGITFFGENIPLRFSKMADTDFEKCDLLVVLGTSLKVEPFNKLIGKVSPRCPRLLINREKAGQELHSGFDFDDKRNYTVQRDALFLGNCDDGVKELASLCGWADELQEMYDTGHIQLKHAEEKEQLASVAVVKDDEDDEELSQPYFEKDDLDTEEDTARNPSTDISASMDSLDDITHRFGRSTLLSQGDTFSQPSVSEHLASKVEESKEQEKSVGLSTELDSASSSHNSQPSLTITTTTTTTIPVSPADNAVNLDGKPKEALAAERPKDETSLGVPDQQQQKLTLSAPIPTTSSADRATTTFTTSNIGETAASSGTLLKTPQLESAALASQPGSPEIASLSDASAGTPLTLQSSTTHGSDSKDVESLYKDKVAKSEDVGGKSSDTQQQDALSLPTPAPTTTLTSTSTPDSMLLGIMTASLSQQSSSPKDTPVAVASVLLNGTVNGRGGGGGGIGQGHLFNTGSARINTFNGGSVHGTSVSHSHSHSHMISSIGNGSSGVMVSHLGSSLGGGDGGGGIAAAASGGGGYGPSSGGGGSTTFLGRVDGPGLMQMVRRKRRKDFELGVGSGMSGSGSGPLRGEIFRYLRGPGAVPAHHLTCGRVSKKRRVV